MKMRTNLLAVWWLFATASRAVAATIYVDLNGPSPTPPYTSWATAARVIQDAVDAASAGDEILVNITGQTGMTSYTDTNVVGSGPMFYRVGVRN